ncbi:hypothetical protein [Haloferula sp.]|uniref:hypothetical protein n=1 Tax=Haloferula sp. TaxID=2497595 RepID=UPI003C75A8E6
MNTDSQVYIQIGDQEPRAIKVNDEDTIASILARLRDENPGLVEDPDLLVVFAEDSDEEIAHARKLCECQPHRPKILHCHRCRKISVSVSYNGEESRKFGPNTKIRRVTTWAKNQFGVDAGRKWVIRLGGAEGDILDPDTKIGKLVSFPDCKLSLFLTERCLIQG